ncbi:MAG: Dna2/Cas4 domain-containing protein [Candidatus Aenigmarchaeota archaeon]|nr:Dna2/Cas4 domain-containing protein [Candidatus Aenigmarchaeota archaeon]
MKKINGILIVDGISCFPVSWLSSRDFCEYQLYLEKIKNVRVEKTIEMVMGSEIHKKLEEEFLLKVTEKMSIWDSLEISKKEYRNFLVRELEVVSKRYGIYGKIDEVQIFPDKILIIDDKPGKKVYNGVKKQVWGYALCFIDQFNPDRDVFTAVRSTDDGEFSWKEKFDENSADLVLNDILEIHDLIKEVRVPKSTLNLNKCGRCRFREVCDRCLVKAPAGK